jgi:tetratricopeptide (TPR) repeat protein
MGGMWRVVVGTPILATLAIGAVVAHLAVERDREYRRLVLEGDDALSRGQTFVAIEAFSGAIALKRDSMLAYLKRGEAHQRRGDTSETLTAALRDLRTAAELDPGATRVLEELGDVNFRLFRYANAAESYEAYLRLDDHAAPVFYKLGLASRGDGRLPRAISALQQAVKLDPSFAEAHYLLGLCFKERGLSNESQKAFEQAILISPALIPAREELADLHQAAGRARAQIEQLEAIAALDPGRAERLIAVGLAYLHAGNREMAVTALGRAAERSPKHPGVYAALGQVWLEAAQDRGDPADLRKALEALTAIASQPSATSEVLGLYGKALALSGQHAEAETAFKQAAERFPADPSVLPQLAAVAQRLGHLDDARQALVRYTALVDNDGAENAVRIGDLSLQLNDPQTAVTWYTKADALLPADPLLLTRLAEAQYKAGQIEGARTTIARALEKDPASIPAQTLARRLQGR